MEDALREYLIKFKKLSIEIIDTITKEDFDTLDSLFSERKCVIESIDALSYHSDEFKALCYELDIPRLEAEIKGILTEKKDKVKQQINKLAEHKSANKSYTKGFSVDSLYFNKKI